MIGRPSHLHTLVRLMDVREWGIEGLLVCGFTFSAVGVYVVANPTGFWWRVGDDSLVSLRGKPMGTPAS